MVSFNRLAVVVGPAEYGKTTFVRKLVREHLTQHPTGLVLAHDPHGSVGRGFCERYADASDVRRALESGGTSERKLVRGFAMGGSSSEVRALAVELGKRWNSERGVRVPVLQVEDESSLGDGSTANHVTPDDRALASNRRHWGVGLVMNVQSPSGVHLMWYEQATDVVMFCLSNEERVRTMERTLGLSKGVLAPLQHAPKFHYVHWRRGEGLLLCTSQVAA